MADAPGDVLSVRAVAVLLGGATEGAVRAALIGGSEGVGGDGMVAVARQALRVEQDPYQVYSACMAAAVHRLGHTVSPSAIYVAGWASGESDHLSVRSVRAGSGIARLTLLADEWHEAGLTHYDSSRVTDCATLAGVLEAEARLRRGELRWLYAHVEPRAELSRAGAVRGPPSQAGLRCARATPRRTAPRSRA